MYRNFHTYFWSDPKIKKWPALAKYHFAYLFTNEHTHLSGIYMLRLSYMQEELGLTAKQIKDNLALFVSENVVEYDYEREVIWVKKMLFHQTHGNPGSRNIKAIASHLENLHNSPLIQAFLLRNKDLDIPYAIGYPDISGIQNNAGYPPDPVPDSVPVLIKGDSKGVTKNVTIHIDNLQFTDSMKAYAAEHGINGHAIDLFGDMVRWVVKNNKKLTNTQRGWEATYQTFVRKAPELSPKYLDPKPLEPRISGIEALRRSKG